MVLQVADAPRQSTFTFLPLGLLRDDADCAQYSHLVEHMIIRSTDPDSLSAPGITFNGETSGETLRVESYAELSAWELSLERHISWLRLEEVSAKTLAREKSRIAQEEESTARNGYTHKWAEAAWNQAIRHRRSHVGLHADVVAATSREVFDYARTHLSEDSEILIASVGPIDPEAIRAKLADGLSSIDRRPPSEVRTSSPIADPSKPTDRTVSWDLEASHYFEWFPLPDRDPRDRVAAHTLTLLINTNLARGKDFQPGHILANSVTTPEGRFLMLSASLESPKAVRLARAAFRSAMEHSLSGKNFPLPLALTQLRTQAAQPIDAGPARKQLEQMGRDSSLVEAQLLLNAVMNEQRLGLKHGEIQAAWKSLSLEYLESFLQAVAKREVTRSLLLVPK